MPGEIRNSWCFNGSELLVECYLRLNGYFTINNFILHDQHGSQKTEVDLIGVRFPNQVEIIEEDKRRLHTLENDPELVEKSNITDVVIAEVTTGEAKINGPFERKDVLQYILDWIGSLGNGARDKAIEALQARNDFLTEDGRIRVRFICFGKHSDDIKCTQLTLDHALSFIRDRFKRYGQLKTHSQQWKGLMRYLYEAATQAISDGQLSGEILEGQWNLEFKQTHG
jgi:hypothetical protein